MKDLQKQILQKILCDEILDVALIFARKYRYYITDEEKEFLKGKIENFVKGIFNK